MKKTPLSPSHYQDGGVETIAYLKAKLSPQEFRGYIKGNVLKYLSRERGKGGDTDLGKAAWYLLYYLGGDQCAAHFVTTVLAVAAKKKARSYRRILGTSKRSRDKRYHPKSDK